MSAVKSLAVVNRLCRRLSHAIYVDGEFYVSVDAVCAIDIMEAAGGPSVPFTLAIYNFDFPGHLDWPLSLDFSFASFERLMSESTF